MMENDAFSQWLGIRVLEVSEGFCRLSMTVRREMLNGFSIAHGGITFSLADSALAFASNSFGRKAVSIETSIHHLEKVEVNDVLIAECRLEYQSEKFGHYSVKVFVEKKELQNPVAFFKGIVYRTSRNWE
jgi:acyl-CoA thioesterase